MLKAIHLTGQLSKREIMLAQSTGGGREATLITGDMVGKGLPSKFSQGIIANVSFVVGKRPVYTILFPIVSL